MDANGTVGTSTVSLLPNQTEALPVSETERLRSEVQIICEQMAILRAWWAKFELAISRALPSITTKVHSSFIEGSLSARAVARAAGNQLRD